MKLELSRLSQLRDLEVDTIIDVRSPSEFAEDHLPGAINLPVLDDEERARVGTIYVRQSRFTARKIGAALVSRNAARHLETALADRGGEWQPLVYCWRGGQRSGSFATILEQVGWRVRLLDGGYRSYRRLVAGMLHDDPLPHRVVLLDGNTGTAKTEILLRLADRGHQVLDLEGLASHRGSIFGDVAAPQPAQKAFESLIAACLSSMDPDRPVFVEAESSRIGTLGVPPQLWKRMCEAPRLRLRVPVEARAEYLTRAYDDLSEDPERLLGAIAGLSGFHPVERIARWSELAKRQKYRSLAQELMVEHYDPRYAKSTSRAGSDAAADLSLPDLSDATLEAEVDRIAEAMLRIDGMRGLADESRKA
ncbi:tRNA 2-selenouridine(34) synthase MnmH [Brevirhabdus pacifica]|uniref:tRNA 2-selenouridine(34) synthase MnmH n=2 Tax=Brevirhabdus pacifica TaxID=1267768 RepID=A0A1U7DJR0_9RHOB|nr:tRNA 2-selenouridine(34) synthase MnmH [Brevirhabdus pacifica]APX90247.1 tRNA 2-selenouridine(34) synthase MnmH [Brevirhabdus pacifica]PJJ80686.1 tRNA 2-selenouridine synthase [Brevirhabdus pacifica]